MTSDEIPTFFTDEGSSSEDNDHEEDSLLLSQSRPHLSRAYPSVSSHHLPIPIHIHEAKSPRTIIIIFLSIIFILEFGGSLMVVPSMRLYENIVCHHYYNKLEGDRHIGFDSNIGEELCKVEDVQNELNVLYAGLNMLSVVPALALTVPYGLMMDRVGRKPVFVLTLIGIIMSWCWDMIVMYFWRVIPLRLIWLECFFTIVGGGEAVASMVIYTIGADVTTEANRSNVFMFGVSITLAAQLLGNSVASSLMTKSPWIPILLDGTFLILGTILSVFIPETLHFRTPSTQSETALPDSISEGSIKLDDSSFFATIKSHLLDTRRKVTGSLSILNSIPVIILLMAFILYPFNNISVGICIRYISNRFKWSLSQAGYLLSLRGLINIGVTLGLLPGLSYILIHRLRLSSREKDLLLAKFSIVLLVFGALLIATSGKISLTITGLIVWTFGTGFLSLVRSLITNLVDEQHIGRLYAIISIVETIGTLVAGPTLAGFYNLGLRWQGSWIGLPFFLLSIVSFLAGVDVWVFGRVTRKPRRDTVLGDEGETNTPSDALLEPDLLG